MSENTEQNKKTTNSNQDIKLWAAISVILIFISVLGYRAYLDTRLTIVSLEEFAQLGDSFGILSSLFSGLAFAGLIVTIVMQNKTLKAQIDGLNRQKVEFDTQKAIMDEQFKAVQLQNFESTLYKLIEFKEKAANQKFGSSGSTFIENIQKEFSDGKVISRSQMSLFKSHEFDLYIRRIIKLLEFFLKDDEDPSRSFFKDIAFDSFIKEEKKMFLWFLEKTTNKIHIFNFRVFLDLGIDFWILFKSNIIFARPNLSECDISDEGDVYHALWKDHNHIIDVVENAVENSYKKCDQGQFIGFLNEYLKALHAEISSIETFKSFGDHEFIKSMISMDDMNERVEEIKIKIDLLTSPAS